MKSADVSLASSGALAKDLVKRKGWRAHRQTMQQRRLAMEAAF
jgi:hypothetical protein